MNKIGDYYDNLYSGSAYVFGGDKGEPHRLVVEALNYVSKGHVLDIGAGEGRNAIFLAQKGFTVEATDVSKVGLQKIEARARKEGLKIQTRLSDLVHDQLQNSYDVIVFSFVAHHLTKQDTLKLIADIKAHTNLGGLNVVMLFTKQGDFFNDKPDTDRYYPEKGELKKLYEDWMVLVYREEISKTRKKKSDGSPMENLASYLIARKV